MSDNKWQLQSECLTIVGSYVDTCGQSVDSSLVSQLCVTLVVSQLTVLSSVSYV